MSDMQQQCERLRELISQYWDIAWREGNEGRKHDTEEGRAQECINEIEGVLSQMQAAQRQGDDPLLFEFGHGDKVVDVGTYGEEHAVFIAPVVNGPGPVGKSSIDSEPQINDRLIDGEKVMTFPTSEQAHAVCDALANKVGQRQGGEAVAYCFVDVNGNPSELCHPPECASPEDSRTIMPLYTAPQPAVPEPERTPCTWTAEDQDGTWATDCGKGGSEAGCEPLGFHGALKLANSVVNAYCEDNPKWHWKIADTPIPNDLAVRMAKVFAGFYTQTEPPEDTA